MDVFWYISPSTISHQNGRRKYWMKKKAIKKDKNKKTVKKKQIKVNRIGWEIFLESMKFVES